MIAEKTNNNGKTFTGKIVPNLLFNDNSVPFFHTCNKNHPKKFTSLLTTFLMVGLGVAMVASAGEKKSPYEKLDQSKLAKTLNQFNMTELLEALARQGKGKKVNIAALSLLVDYKITLATQATDQESRDRLLDEAIVDLDKLIAATEKAKDDATVLQHHRFILKRIVIEGITKADKYAERVSYFLASPEDPKILARLTRSALTRLERLLSDLTDLQDEWADDEGRMVTGAAWQLDSLIEEAHYRGAWIRLYRAMVLPAGSDERLMLLEQAIQDVKKFADAEDNSSGVKFYSLLLSGICYRLLGKWQQADSYLDRAADKQAAPAVRLKALFEKVLCHIDQKKFAEAAKAIEQFRKRGTDLGMPKVAVDMQAALLASRLADVQAEALEQSDPQAARKFRAKSRKYLLDFLEKYPDYREAFVEIIAAKYEGVDTKELFPDMKVLLGIRLYNKALRKYESSPQKVVPLDLLTKAEKYFDEVLSDKRAGKKTNATALWYLALIRNLERRNLEAAAYFQQLAQEYPDDERARDSAIYAVRSLRGIMAEKKVEPTEMGTTFVNLYARCLSTLVKNWGKTDPEIRSYNYELGMLYDKLGRTAEAIDAFERIPSSSQLYIPARFRLLTLRVRSLLDSTLPEAQRRDLALALISDLQAYTRTVRSFIKSADKVRAAQARLWAAECVMLQAQLTKDILNQPIRSISMAQSAAQQWPGVPGIKRRSQQFIARVLLESGQTNKAIDYLLKLVKQSPEGIEDLIAKATGQIRTRINRLEFRTDPESRKKLASLREAYRILAQKLYEWAKTAKLSTEQMYAFKQALAAAYESSVNPGDPNLKMSLDLYRELQKQKPNDAKNFLGLARCYRSMGRYAEAMKQYDLLRQRLPEKSTAWWRVQVERLQLAMKMFGDNADGLKDILLQIRVLRYNYEDPKMGGFWQSFNTIESEARKRLEAIGKTNNNKMSASGSVPEQPELSRADATQDRFCLFPLPIGNILILCKWRHSQVA